MIKFENKENGRYYYLHVETDIFGHHVLTVTRGGSMVHLRPERLVAGNMRAIQDKIQEITKTRLRRGYTIVN